MRPRLLPCLFLLPLALSAAVIEGDVRDITGTNSLNTAVRFTPLSFPVSVDSGTAVAAGPARTIVPKAGLFTNSFAPGVYKVSIGAFDFYIGVPDDSNTYSLPDLATNGLITYTYTNPIPYNVIAGAAGIAVSTNSANFYITNTLPGLSNVTETARSVTIDGTVTNLDIGDSLRTGTGSTWLTINDGASEIAAETAAFKVSGSAYVDRLTSTNGVTVTTGGITNHTASGFVGNGGNLTNLNAANIAAGGTLPALNAANLTNLLWYDVTDYGATGDGVTSDVTSIQAAVDAAQTAGGGVVYFPPGTYALDATAGTSGYNDQNGTGGNICIRSNNVHLVGAGIGATTIKRTAGTTARNMFNSFNTTNISIRDMTLDANLNAYVQNMTSFYTNENVIVTRTEWKNHDGSDWDALEMTPTTAMISDSIFTNIAANALAIDGSSGINTVGYVDNCHFVYCGGKSYTYYTNTPTWYPGNWAAIQLRQGKFFLNNVYTESCATSLQLLGTFLSMDNCYFSGTGASQTNMFIPQGTVHMNNCTIAAVGSGSCAVYASGLASYGGTSGGSGASLYMDNCNITATAGYALIGSNRLVVANSRLTVGNPAYTVVLGGGGYHRFTGNYIGNNGVRAVSADNAISNSVFTGNQFVDGSVVWLSTTGGANTFADNLFDGATTYLQCTSASNLISGNNFINGAALRIATGSAGTVIAGNKLQDLTFVNTVAVTLRDNVVTGTLTGTAAQIAGASWRGNTDGSGVPIKEPGAHHAGAGSIGCSTAARWPSPSFSTTLSAPSQSYVIGNVIFTNLTISVLSSGNGTNYTVTLYTNGAASLLTATAAGNGGTVTGNSGTNGVTLANGSYWSWHIIGDNTTSELKIIDATWETINY